MKENIIRRWLFKARAEREKGGSYLEGQEVDKDHLAYKGLYM